MALRDGKGSLNSPSGSLQIKIDNNKEKNEALKSFRKDACTPTISRVPDVLREMNKGAYTPCVVAIGPLHRDKMFLQAMEGDKISYTQFLFERTRNFEQTQNECFAAMLEIESDVGDDYEGVRLDGQGKPQVEYLEYSKSSGDVKGCGVENYRLAEMMVIDGCFIIELMYRSWSREKNDPILSNPLKRELVKRDLLLLENQIPFSVLERLFEYTVKRFAEPNNPSLLTCILSYFSKMILLEGKGETQKVQKVAHILHVLHNHYLPRASQSGPAGSEDQTSQIYQREVYNNFKYSATDLDLAGIEFVKGNENELFDLKFISDSRFCYCFCRKGRFEIPPFNVSDITEPFFRNLIAFEQTCGNIAEMSYFTSHALLMDRLINSPDDVKLLEKAGIIHNNLGTTEDIAHLFNSLCKNVAISKLYSAEQCLKVFKFQKQRWPRLIVKLKRDYFSSPWSYVSVIAAFILFVLTLLQTIYTMLSYY